MAVRSQSHGSRGDDYRDDGEPKYAASPRKRAGADEVGTSARENGPRERTCERLLTVADKRAKLGSQP